MERESGWASTIPDEILQPIKKEIKYSTVKSLVRPRRHFRADQARSGQVRSVQITRFHFVLCLKTNTKSDGETDNSTYFEPQLRHFVHDLLPPGFVRKMIAEWGFSFWRF